MIPMFGCTNNDSRWRSAPQLVHERESFGAPSLCVIRCGGSEEVYAPTYGIRAGKEQGKVGRRSLTSPLRCSSHAEGFGSGKEACQPEVGREPHGVCEQGAADRCTQVVCSSGVRQGHRWVATDLSTWDTGEPWTGRFLFRLIRCFA